MNYKKHYELLIETRKDRILESGISYERHHIIPKCMKGTDDISNIILLTLKEHFIAHLLLYKASDDIDEKYKLGWAVWNMSGSTCTNKRIIPSKQFEISRKILGEISSKRIVSEETRKKLSSSKIGNKNPMYGKTHTQQVLDIIKTKQRKYWTEEKRVENGIKTKQLWENPEYRLNISNKLSGRKLTDDQKKKISNSNKGRQISDNHRKRISETLKNKPKHECPYCKINCNYANFKRWHGENCKYKTTSIK